MRPRPEYESTSETAERTGLCTRTIRRRIADGTTTGYRVVGGRASPDELPEMPAAWIAGPTSSANGSSGYTDPDPDDLIENGIPVGVSQHDTLRGNSGPNMPPGLSPSWCGTRSSRRRH
jgi:hypothetical protein